MSDNTLLSLIKEYISTAEKAVGMLRNTYNVVDLLSAWRQGIIPSMGQMPSGLCFQFHGIGCTFESNEVAVDVDFGPNGRCDGFDAWRLLEFARNGRIKEDGITLEQIRTGLVQLQEAGIVVCPNWLPSPHLVYLVAAASSD